MTIPCLRVVWLATAVVFAGLLALAAWAGQVHAHDPVRVQPDILVLEPGQGGDLELTLVNAAAPPEPAQAARLAPGQVASTLELTLDAGPVPPEATQTLRGRIAVGADAAGGAYLVRIDAFGETTGSPLTAGFLTVLVPPEPGEAVVTPSGQPVYLLTAPSVVYLEPGGTGVAEVMLINGTGAPLRLAAESGAPAAGVEIAAQPTAEPFQRIPLFVRGPESSAGTPGIFTVVITATDPDGAVLATGRLLVGRRVNAGEGATASSGRAPSAGSDGAAEDPLAARDTDRAATPPAGEPAAAEPATTPAPPAADAAEDRAGPDQDALATPATDNGGLPLGLVMGIVIAVAVALVSAMGAVALRGRRG